MENFKKYLNKETMNYLIFGVLTTLIDFGVYLVCKKLSVNYLVANIIAWTCAFLFAFVTNKLIVFQSKSIKWNVIINEFFGFLGARLSSLLFSLVFIYLTVTVFQINDIIAKIISSIFVVIINYILSKFLVFNQKDDTQKSFFRKLQENLVFILSFVIPLVLLVVLYHSKKIYPFGDNMYLRSDCYHQYAPFMMEFYNKLTHGGSFTYSWNVGLGSNFSALYAYYLASPLNSFIGLFSKNYIIEIMNVFIIVKTALSSLSFSYYLSKHFHTKKITLASMSIFYAINSYFCAYSWNLMWLDCLVLLPLIVLGLEKLVKEDKCYLYCITLGLAILSNYYIAIMICIFCIIYFAAMIYSDNTKKTFLYYVKKCRNFTVFSLLAGGFAAVTFLPAYYALGSTASSDFNFPKEVITYFSALFMMSRSLINVEPAIFSAHDPNIYCTVAVLLFVPLYVVNPKIKFKEKIAKVSIVCFLLFSFNTNIPNYIWHGFHYPNSLPCRESFIYIFMVLAMSYEALFYARENTRKQIYGCFAGAIALILVIEQLFVNDTYKAITIYTSIGFLIFYLIVLSLYRNTNYKQGFVAYLLLIIVVCEAYINTEATALSTSTRSAYLDDNKAIEELVDVTKEIEGDNFYRIEKISRRSKNDAAWSNYHGASIFSSTANVKLSEFYGAVGLEESTNAYAYYGHTPLTEGLLGVKYVLSSYSQNESDYLSYLSSTEYEDHAKNTRTYYLYKNNYSLPLGFMLPANMEEKWDISDPNPFTVQNNLATAIMGSSYEDRPLYTRLNVSDEIAGQKGQYVDIKEYTHLFIYVTTSLDSIKVSKTTPDGGSTAQTYYSMTHSHMLDLGYLPEGSSVNVSSSDSEVPNIQFYAYSFDDDYFKEIYDNLNTNTLKVSNYTDTSVSGTVNVSKAGLLYTSIPYDKGWKIYVDGKEYAPHAFKGALMSVYLNPGSHDIEFKYTSVGYYRGLILSAVSVLIFISILITDYRKNKYIAQEKNQ